MKKSGDKLIAVHLSQLRHLVLKDRIKFMMDKSWKSS